MKTSGLFFAAALLPIAFAVGCSARTQQAALIPTPAPVPTAPPAPAPTPVPAPPPISTPGAGHVFTMTNSTIANSIVVLTAAADGSLSVAATIPTGGTGAGFGLQNQGAVALNEDRSLLFVVNAASNDFTVFRVNGGDLTLASRTPSGGLSPVSISVAKGIVYVLNDGSRASSTDNVSGFRVATDGTVTPIPSSTRGLSASSTGAAQVALSPDAKTLMVTERSTAILDVIPLDSSGNPGSLTANVSSGTIPFGFQFLDATHVFVSEEGPNAVSSYTVAGSRLSTITASAPNFQSATCWLAITPDGKFLYTTNTSRGTISVFSIASSGATALVGSTGVAATASGLPIDTIVSIDGSFLYVVNTNGNLDTFRISAANGSLTLIQTLSGFSATLNGVVAS